jgi:hypothetical protein
MAAVFFRLQGIAFPDIRLQIGALPALVNDLIAVPCEKDNGTGRKRRGSGLPEKAAPFLSWGNGRKPSPASVYFLNSAGVL